MLRISLCLVFLRNSNNNPGHWEHPHMDTDRWTCIHILLMATMLDHLTAGSIQCLSWKSSQEVPDLLELPETSSPELSTVYRTVFFCNCKIQAVDRKTTKMAFHGTCKYKRNAHRLQLWPHVAVIQSHVNGRQVRRLSSHDVVQPGLKWRCYSARPYSSKIRCCQVFVLFICEYHIFNVVFLTNVIFVISCFLGKRVF